MTPWLVLLLACGSGDPAAPHAPSAPAERAAPMADAVTVTDARARAMPPAAPNSGAFFTLRNAGASEAKLVAARAEVSRAVELHTHVEEDGVMRMRQIPEIGVPAGGETVLQPGGLHVMLIGLNEPLKEGQQFPLVLEFADGSQTTLDVPVKAIGRH